VGTSPAVDVSLEDRVLDAAIACCERWGRDKVTVDDIATEARCSRATIYRLFPGGKDNLFEALRVRESTDFFQKLEAHLAGAVDFEDLLVRGVLHATELLRADEHLRLMLASSPGEVAQDLTVDGLPRIVATASAFLTPWFAPHIGERRSPELAEWLSRIVLSYFLAPSQHVDLADRASVVDVIRRFVLPAFPPEE
jgi:AcrR family transcriptional regulator